MNSIEKLFVPYEIALDLKLLGFNEECLAKFYLDSLELEGVWKNSDFHLEDFYISAPTYSQCFSWFRNNYHIHIKLDAVNFPSKGRWIYQIYQYNNGQNIINSIDKNYLSYEKAELECLKQLIKEAKEL